MWEISIKPSRIRGNGGLIIAQEKDGESRECLIIEDFRKIRITADNRVELYRGLMAYGDITARWDKAEMEAFLDSHPEFKPLTTEERRANEAALREYEQSEEGQKDYAQAGEIMSGK